MSPRIFITGASGYIGGQTVTDLSIKHPGYEIVALVRTDEQAQKLKAGLPSIQTVKGDLTSHEVLLKEARNADVVINAADCDFVLAVKTLITGLAQGDKRGSFIQLSGAGSIFEAPNGYGNPSTRVYDDVKDVSEITTFDSSHLHWEADQTVIREGKRRAIRTAIVVPPVVFGSGTGLAKKTGMPYPGLAEVIVKRGRGFTIREGKAILSGIHVKDLASAIILLVEDALKPAGAEATWGPEGIYYVESGDFVYGDIVSGLVKLLREKGSIGTTDIDQVEEEKALSIHPWALILWGSNMRCRATRLQTLGWKPAQGSFRDNMPELLVEYAEEV